MMNTPKYSEAPYPFNLFIRLHEYNSEIPFEKDKMYDDWYGTLQYMLIERITQRERRVLYWRFNQKLTLDTTSKEMGLSRERIRQIEDRALTKLALGIKSSILIYGLGALIKGDLTRHDQTKAQTKTRPQIQRDSIEAECLISKAIRLAKNPLELDVGYLGMSTYLSNALRRGGILTANDILEISSINELLEIQGIGRSSARSVLNVRDILARVMEEREHAKLGPECPLYELDLSIRAFNALRRTGYETVKDVMEASEADILAIRNIGKKTLNEILEKIEVERKKMNGTASDSD